MPPKKKTSSTKDEDRSLPDYLKKNIHEEKVGDFINKHE